MALRPILKLDQLVAYPSAEVAPVLARRRTAERVRGLRAEMKPFAAHGVSWAATVFVLASGRGHRIFENAEVGDFLAAPGFIQGIPYRGLVARVHLIARRQF